MTTTSVQLEELLEFMSTHRDVARGFINSVEGRARTKRLWENLASRLNSLGGAVKTVQQWKKVWADKKYMTKKASAAARRSATGTGGGPPTADPLSQNDHKVISIMGVGFGQPDIPACSVPAFPEILEWPTNYAAPSEPPATLVRSAPPAAEAQDSPIIAQARPRTSGSNIPASRRPRRRQRLMPSDTRAEILRLEKGKNVLLAGILGELKILNENIGKIVSKM